jgi:hypothetical protein
MNKRGDRMKSKSITSILLIAFALFSVFSGGASEIKKIEEYFSIDELYGLKYIEQVCGIFGLKYTRQDDLIILSNGMEFLRSGRAIKNLNPLEFDDSKEVFQRIK